MRSTNITRKDFIRNAAFSTMGLGLVPALGSGASALPVAPENREGAGRTPGKQLVLKNVRLETGFEYDREEVITGMSPSEFKEH